MYWHAKRERARLWYESSGYSVKQPLRAVSRAIRVSLFLFFPQISTRDFFHPRWCSFRLWIDTPSFSTNHEEMSCTDWMFGPFPLAVFGLLGMSASLSMIAGCGEDSSGPSYWVHGDGGDERTAGDAGDLSGKDASDDSVSDHEAPPKPDGSYPEGDVPDSSASQDGQTEGAATGSCDGVDCSGHGTCSTSTGACECHEGFEGVACETLNGDYGKRVKIVEGLADPDVLKLTEERFVLSGTSEGQATDFRFRQSYDLIHWDEFKVYRPSDIDPAHRYCWMWAPAIVQEAGGIALYFSALQLGKFDGPCPPIEQTGKDVATFRAFASGDTFDFGKPEPLFPGTKGPRTYTAAGCPELCGNAIRIDPAVLDGRLYYVYFAGGNNVTSIRLSDASDQLFHTGPDIKGARDPDEGIINEAPEAFSRQGRLYLFFSTADFRGPYTTRYMIGNTAADLRRSLTVAHRLTTPAYGLNGKLVETHGHNSVTTWRGETFNFFHVGVFHQGNLVRRDTYRQRIVWKDDGTAVNQNAVHVSWNSLGGAYVYSFDLVLRDGSTIGPCIGSGILGKATSVTYTGVCKDANDRLVHKAEVGAFRIYASSGGGVYHKVGEVSYDGYSDTVSLTISPP